MSRCFPYPPPGYSKLNRSSSNESLIESIKLQREREQAKAESKKEKKREKKEKRKDKKEKANPKHCHFSHDQKLLEKSWIGPKDGFLHWAREEDNEQLERSSLTEEHEQPIRSQNPSSSSDSTQNSNKRKKHTSPAIFKEEGYVTRGRGNIIRIRLSSQKQQRVDSSVGREEPCSTSRRTDLPAQQEHQIAPRAVQENPFPTPQGANDVIGVLPHRPDGEQICSTSGKTIAVINENASTSGCKRPEKKLQRLELQYEDLIENWIPPPLQTQLDFDDQDWLLVREYPENQIERKFKASNDISFCSSSALWPCAQFLPEAGVYSLPFTVPF